MLDWILVCSGYVHISRQKDISVSTKRQCPVTDWRLRAASTVPLARTLPASSTAHVKTTLGACSHSCVKLPILWKCHIQPYQCNLRNTTFGTRPKTTWTLAGCSRKKAQMPGSPLVYGPESIKKTQTAGTQAWSPHRLLFKYRLSLTLLISEKISCLCKAFCILNT